MNEENSVPNPDRIKRTREEELRLRASERSKSGVWPNRFRGYYRALRRREDWALNLNRMPKFSFLLAWTYREPMLSAAISSTPFLIHTSNYGGSCSGSYYPIQFPYFKIVSDSKWGNGFRKRAYFRRKERQR